MCTLRDFSDKVVLVTGSTSGIGLATAKYFSQCGAHVVVTGRNESRLEKAGQECELLSPKRYKPLMVKADVTNEDDCKRLMTATVDQFGKLDVLVNNAGSGVLSSIYDPKFVDILQNMLDVNLKSVARMTNLAVAHLEKTGGVIVNISSTVSVKPYASFMPYCVAKAGLDMFTRCLALELGPKGVRVNSVNPTAVRTNFQASMNAGDVIDSVVAHLENVNPLKRIATTEDVVNAIAFLSSNDSSFVTGHSLMVDGGSIYV